MDAASLLSIDVAAELRKTAVSRLAGPFAVPAELVRRAVAAGAGRVEVSLGRGELRVRDDGAPLAAAAAERLAVLLDGSAPPERRHAALLALEASPEAALLGLLALDPVEVDLPAAGSRVRLREGRPPERGRADPGPGELRVRCRGLDRRAAGSYLAAVCRFAPVPVLVDGKSVGGGFDLPVVETALRPPLAGRLALTRLPAPARLWVTVHGVVSAHLTVAEVPAFEASLDLTGSPAAGGGPGGLRAQVEEHLGELLEQAARLVLGAASQTERVPAEGGRSLREALLTLARDEVRRAEALAAPAFPSVGPGGEGPRFVSLAEAGVGPAPCALPVVGSLEEARRSVLPAGPTLVLDAAERSRVGELFGVRFVPVPPRPPAPRRGAESLARVWRTAREVASAGGLPRTIAEAELRDAERGLRRALEALAVPGRPVRVDWCRGAAPPIRLGRGRVCLSRGDALAAAAARLLARSAAWTFPVALALLGAVPPRDARSWWRTVR